LLLYTFDKDRHAERKGDRSLQQLVEEGRFTQIKKGRKKPKSQQSSLHMATPKRSTSERSGSRRISKVIRKITPYSG